MRRLIAICVVLLMGGEAAAEERGFGIGLARPGMRLGEFRYAAHPAGAKVVCSNDQTKPPGSERTALDLPKAMAKAQVNRCALFVEVKGLWEQTKVPLGGTPAEFWLMAILDEAGTERVVQVYARQPPDAFEGTVAALGQRFGTPAVRDTRQAQWKTPQGEAQVAGDGIATQVFLTEPKLQALLQSRLQTSKQQKR